MTLYMALSKAQCDNTSFKAFFSTLHTLRCHLTKHCNLVDFAMTIHSCNDKRAKYYDH